MNASGQPSFDNTKENSKFLSRFTELKLDINGTRSATPFDKDIDIILSVDLPENTLPLANIYTSSKLFELDLIRINQCLVLARGESRMPEELIEHGYITKEAEIPKPNAADNSKLVNYSLRKANLLKLTKEINSVISTAEKNEYGCIYLAKIAGPLVMRNAVNNEAAEYFAPDEITLNDIIAFRRFTNRHPDGSIFVDHEFMRNNPQHVDNLIDSLLRNNECCMGYTILNSKIVLLKFSKKLLHITTQVLNETLPKLNGLTQGIFELTYQSAIDEMVHELEQGNPNATKIHNQSILLHEALDIIHKVFKPLGHIKIKADRIFKRLTTAAEEFNLSKQKIDKKTKLPTKKSKHKTSNVVEIPTKK